MLDEDLWHDAFSDSLRPGLNVSGDQKNLRCQTPKLADRGIAFTAASISDSLTKDDHSSRRTGKSLRIAWVGSVELDRASEHGAFRFSASLATVVAILATQTADLGLAKLPDFASERRGRNLFPLQLVDAPAALNCQWTRPKH